MHRIIKTGAAVELEIIPRTSSRGTVIARIPENGQLLKIDDINITSEKERIAFVSDLGERAAAAAVFLQQAAAELAAGITSLEVGAVSLATWPTGPWLEPVDGASLLDAIEALVARHVVMDKRAQTLVALWIIHTHAIDATDCSPILALLSPAMRSGKTSLLQVLELLVRDGVPVTNLTSAGLFRTIEQGQPTLLIDEADTFLEKNHELIGLLNKGHTRPGAFTIRNDKQGEAYVPRRFSLWAAKAIAAIGRLPATLLDRSIISPMRRKGDAETVERIRSNRFDSFHALRAQAARWASDNLETLREADPELPLELNNREADSWRPLFAIAQLTGGGWIERAREAAVTLRTRDTSSATVDIRLLSDIRDIFAANPAYSFIPTQLLLPMLYAQEGSPWAEYAYGKPITGQGLARLLEPYGITTAKKRITGTKKNLWVYHRSSFEAAWAQYLPPVTEHPEHAEPPPNVPHVPGVPSTNTPPGHDDGGKPT